MIFYMDIGTYNRLDRFFDEKMGKNQGEIVSATTTTDWLTAKINRQLIFKCAMIWHVFQPFLHI